MKVNKVKYIVMKVKIHIKKKTNFYNFHNFLAISVLRKVMSI